MKAHNNIRCFLALYPDTTALAAMASFIERLNAANNSVRWEKPAQVHITAKFIEEIEAERIVGIGDLLKRELRAIPVFSAMLDRVGGFPNLRRPRIVWMGFSGRVSPLHDFQRICEDVCFSEGIARETKVFTPHFTIGRTRQHARPDDLEKDISSCSFTPVPVLFDAVRIMQSRLAPAGAIHTEVVRIPFLSEDSR